MFSLSASAPQNKLGRLGKNKPDGDEKAASPTLGFLCVSQCYPVYLEGALSAIHIMDDVVVM